jgi:molybdate transport system regulatory protein
VKRVQALARLGRLPAVRIGRKWLFPRTDLLARLGTRAGAHDSLEISARNRLRGTVTSVAVDGVMAEVRMRIADQELVSIITRGSAERLDLREGDEVYAVVKATEVMIGKGDRA